MSFRCAESKKLATLRRDITDYSFSPDGTSIATASSDHTIHLVEIASGTEFSSFNFGTAIQRTFFSPDGRRIVALFEDGDVRVLDARRTMESFRLEANDERAQVWDAETGAEIACLNAYWQGLNSASPNDRRIVIRVLDAESGNEIARLSNADDVVSFSPDGRRIVTVYDDTARVWDAESGAEILCLKGHTEGVTSASFSPDGPPIRTRARDKTARVWDAESGTEILCLKGHTEGVTSASFSPDGRRIVTGSHDNTVRVWDAESGAEILCLKGHGARVTSASFSPDGRQIVTVYDNTARVWDMESGAEVACLKGHTTGVTSASFSPDGHRIVTQSFGHYAENTTRVWDVTRAAAIAREPAIVLTAALARGIGWRTEDEAADLLMQDAPEDLYAAARQQLLDPAKYRVEEIARRERALEETIAALHAPLHPNCYLSPTQFAEKFGLPMPGKAAHEPAFETGG